MVLLIAATKGIPGELRRADYWVAAKECELKCTNPDTTRLTVYPRYENLI